MNAHESSLEEASRSRSGALKAGDRNQHDGTASNCARAATLSLVKATQEAGAGKGANSTEHEGTEREGAALEDEGAGGGEREGEDTCGSDGSDPEASTPKVYSVEAVFKEERQGRVPGGGTSAEEPVIRILAATAGQVDRGDEM